MGAIQIPAAVFRRAHEASAQLCDAAEEAERKEPFNTAFLLEFMRDFSECAGDAEMWLQDQGVDRTCIATAEMMRTMCRSYLVNPLAVYAVAGDQFEREIAKLAYEVWSSR